MLLLTNILLVASSCVSCEITRPHPAGISHYLFDEVKSDYSTLSSFFANEMQYHQRNSKFGDSNYYLRLHQTSENFQYNLNNFFDYIIKAVTTIMAESGDLTIALPNVEKRFKRGLISGKLTGSGGYFRNVASLERTADAEIKMDGSMIYLNASFGLSEFEAGFRNYSFELGGIKQTGEMHFKVRKNSLTIAMSHDILHLCKLRVEAIHLDELEGMDIQIDGLGDFQGLVKILTDWIMHAFRRTFRKTVNAEMEVNINAALHEYMGPFCKNLSERL